MVQLLKTLPRFLTTKLYFTTQLYPRQESSAAINYPLSLPLSPSLFFFFFLNEGTGMFTHRTLALAHTHAHNAFQRVSSSVLNLA